MKAEGTIKNITEADGGKDIEVVLALKPHYKPQAEKLKAACSNGCSLNIDVDIHRESRSANANAYFWALVDRISKTIGSDKDSVYLLQLQKYGRFTDVIVKASALDGLKKAYRLVEELPSGFDGGYINARCYYGSSTYDAKEMAELIEGTVGDAEDLGIETLSSEETKRLIDMWAKRND